MVEGENGKVPSEDVFFELVLGDTLGSGRYCKVKKALGEYCTGNPDDKNIPYAVKVFNKREMKGQMIMLPTGISNMLDSSEKEIFLAGEMDHPNVSKTFSNFDTEPNPEGKFYLMIELGDLGTIASVEDDNSPDPVFILN